MPDHAQETVESPAAPDDAKAARDLERVQGQLARVRQYRDLVHRLFGDLRRELDNPTLDAVRRADLEQQQRVFILLDADLRCVQKLLESLTQL